MQEGEGDFPGRVEVGAGNRVWSTGGVEVGGSQSPTEALTY